MVLVSTKAEILKVENEFYVHIISNKKTRTIYIGHTNDLKKECIDISGTLEANLQVDTTLKILVYYEKFKFPMPAIKREKQLKKWNRRWKINLINDINPNWED
ncbi:GIY-YIG nuclease family protein [Muricauda sp. JGD-17]|uniref:GIY-YIG nuclease family protein n=1 Tax=Flagellimonas ochracea TaxID=2696472 RepID=A0A964TCV3_9FLAO|nr:GIY-YIG nuclease family protein [Allomuricauda ochracea]